MRKRLWLFLRIQRKWGINMRDEDVKKEQEALEALVVQIMIYQSCRKNLKMELLKTKFQSSYKKMIKDIRTKYTNFLMIGMIRQTNNLESYLYVLNGEIKSHNPVFVKSCNYLSGKQLKESLKKIKGEILEMEALFCKPTLEEEKGTK